MVRTMGYVSTPAYTSRSDAEGAAGQPLDLDGLGEIRAYEIPAAGGPIQIIVDDAGVGGFGKKLRRAVKKVSAPVRKVAKVVTKPVKQAVKAVAQAPKMIAGVIGGAKASVAEDGGVQYTDENGNPITQAQYEAAMAQQGAPASAGAVIPYQAPATAPGGGGGWGGRIPYPWEDESWGAPALTDAAPEEYGSADYNTEDGAFEGHASLGEYLNQVQRDEGIGWLSTLTNLLPAITQAGTGVASLVFARQDAKKQESQASAQAEAAKRAAAAEEMKAKAALIEAEKMRTSAAGAGGTQKTLLIGGAVVAVVAVGVVIYLATRNRAPKA